MKGVATMAEDVVVLHVRVATLGRRAASPCCQGCGEALELHQPMPDRPGEMLGTCPACGGWHFLGMDDDGHARLVAQLPLAELVSPGGGTIG